MIYGKYTFICRLESDAVLPYYKGSTFRGVFGHALKRVVCALKRQVCETCLLKTNCLYTRVFETPVAGDAGAGRHISAAPHPFVIEPPPEPDTGYRPGDRFRCSLLLFGEVNEKLPYFVYAFDRMGKIGVGRRINGSRGRFVLERVESNGNVIYSEADRILKTEGTTRILSVTGELNGPGPVKTLVRRGKKIPLSNSRPVRQIRVTLETPLRFKFRGRLSDGLPFHVLVRIMLRRISSLMNAYSGGEPDLDYRGLVERAKAVETVRSDLRWFDWRRYSNRRNCGILMGGITGSVTYAGNPAEYLPLLDFCKQVHIGKNTSFGLGKIRI